MSRTQTLHAGHVAPAMGVARVAAGDNTRDERLDALRGVLLLLMTGTHVNTPISEWTHAPLGFVGSAEGFIVLSAYLVGRVYSRQLTRHGAPAMARNLLLRARKVYVVHLLLLVPAVLLASALASSFPGLANHFRPFLTHPVESLIMIPLLMHQPPLFDILPLYAVYLALTPALLLAACRFGWGSLLVGAALLWTLSQHDIGWRTELVSVDTPGIYVGHFDMLAWQLIWVVGLLLGARSIRPVSASLRRIPGKILLGAVALSGSCFALRYWAWPLPAWHDLISRLSDKWTLGPLRIVNLMALLALIVRFDAKLPSWLLAVPSMLGRHSLLLFAVHIVIAIAAAMLLESTPWSRMGATGVGVACMAFLCAAAWFLEQRVSSATRRRSRSGNGPRDRA